MKIELEFLTLLIIQTTIISAFAKFEVETPLLKKLVKWFIIDGITIALYFLVGHWAMLFIILSLAPGTVYHFIWCKKNNIHPLKATPRRKYYELRKWKMPE